MFRGRADAASLPVRRDHRYSTLDMRFQLVYDQRTECTRISGFAFGLSMDSTDDDSAAPHTQLPALATGMEDYKCDEETVRKYF